MKFKFLALLFLFLFLSGCISSNSANVYSRNTAMKAQTVEKGMVESVRQAKIEGTKTPIGTTVGAVTGGILGSTIGSGSGHSSQVTQKNAIIYSVDSVAGHILMQNT